MKNKLCLLFHAEGYKKKLYFLFKIFLLLSYLIINSGIYSIYKVYVYYIKDR